MHGDQRILIIDDEAERENLAAFLTRVVRLDPAAVVRVRRRAPLSSPARPETTPTEPAIPGRVSTSSSLVTAWVVTNFATLATRTLAARLTVADATVAADSLLAAVPTGPKIPLGFAMDSLWRAGLPPTTGFTHIDDIPARDMVALAERGAALAAAHGSGQGPPVSLLDQPVLTVSGAGRRIAVPMRAVFTLTAMDFLPHTGDKVRSQSIAREDIVRVRATDTWLRLDARYGSVARRRSPLLMN